MTIVSLATSADPMTELMSFSERFVAPASETVSHHGHELDTLSKTVKEMEKLLAALETQIECLSTQKTLLERQLTSLLEEDRRIDKEFEEADQKFNYLSSWISSYSFPSCVSRIQADVERIKKSPRVVFIEGPHEYGFDVGDFNESIPGHVATRIIDSYFIFSPVKMMVYRHSKSALVIL
jgi:hypothetical protein